MYGYRKVHHDLMSLGETCTENTVAHLMQAEGLRAQIGYKRRLGNRGSKPSVVDANKLERVFEADAPDLIWGTSLLIRTQCK